MSKAKTEGRAMYFSVQQTGKTADIYIFGDITSWEWLESDVSSYTLARQLQDLDANEIVVHINSYGGEVAEGIAIHNSLKNHKAKVTTVCDGFACSAASVVFMAGDERLMNPASLLMIHNAWSCAAGNAAELRKAADDLEVISKTAAEVYKAHVNISEEELQALLDGESWISPAGAVEKGFATGFIVAPEEDGIRQSARGTVFEALRQSIGRAPKHEAPPPADPAPPEDPKTGAGVSESDTGSHILKMFSK